MASVPQSIVVDQCDMDPLRVGLTVEGTLDFIQMRRYYSRSRKAKIEADELTKCVFKLPVDIDIDDRVVLDSTVGVCFIDDGWDISGDYCVFAYRGSNMDGVILIPDSSMRTRGKRSHDEMRILLPYSNELVMVIPR